MDIGRSRQDATQVGDTSVGQGDDTILAFLERPEDPRFARMTEPGKTRVHLGSGNGFGCRAAHRYRNEHTDPERRRVPARFGTFRPDLIGRRLEVTKEPAGQDDIVDQRQPVCQLRQVRQHDRESWAVEVLTDRVPVSEEIGPVARAKSPVQADLGGHRREIGPEGRKLTIGEADPDPGPTQGRAHRCQLGQDIAPVDGISRRGSNPTEPDDVDSGSITQPGEARCAGGSHGRVHHDAKTGQSSGRRDRRLEVNHVRRR